LPRFPRLWMGTKVCHNLYSSIDHSGSFNGSVVSNKGFIRQFNPGATILDAKWVSAWGGTASAAQCLSQVAISFVSDKFGRRVALWTTWVLLTAVRQCRDLSRSSSLTR
jgi:hypothetical protein